MVLVALIRCMLDVIIVTHKTMMTLSGTHIQGLHSTQVRHHTQIDLLTCRVCFVKHMMITSEVRHHTLLDLSTNRVCSVKHGMIMHQCFPRLWYDPYPLYACGLCLCLFLVSWSVICCQDGCLTAFAKCAHNAPLGASPEEYKVHCPKSISVTILTSNAWEDTRLI